MGEEGPVAAGRARRARGCDDVLPFGRRGGKTGGDGGGSAALGSTLLT